MTIYLLFTWDSMASSMGDWALPPQAYARREEAEAAAKRLFDADVEFHKRTYGRTPTKEMLGPQSTIMEVAVIP